jgi:hypothetical protein
VSKREPSQAQADTIIAVLTSVGSALSCSPQRQRYV